MADAIAIDFGTVRTKVAYLDDDTGKPALMRLRHYEEPYLCSLFYLGRNQQGIVLGDEAEAMLEEDPAGIVDVLKRRLRERYVWANQRKERPQALLTALFAELRQRAGQELTAFAAKPPVHACLTLPAMYGPADEQLLRQAAAEAGFEQVDTVPEPVAAARAWLAESNQQGRDIIVLDAGGGTLDWAYLTYTGKDFRVVAECPPGGEWNIGGRDVDEELLGLVKERLDMTGQAETEPRRTHLLQQLRIIKERYSRNLALPFVKVESQTLRLEPEAIEQVIEERYITQAIEGLKPYLETVKRVNNGCLPPVLLVGGSARLKGLKEAIEQRLNCKTLRWERSEYATVLGAAYAMRPCSDLPKEEGEPDLKQVDLEQLRRLAASGDAAAQFELAYRCHDGRGVQQDDAEAERWVRKSAEQGYPPAQASLGTFYYKGVNVKQDYAEAARWVRKAAKQGDANGQQSLGYLYYAGEGVKQNFQEAARWFRKAADQGNASAQVSLANLYYSGEGVPQDFQKAVRWFRKAANQADGAAQLSMGHLCYSGEGVKQNYSQAADWFRQAADQGQANAFYMLGQIHLEGKIANSDPDEALRYFRSAAKMGDSNAKYTLGSMYCEGFHVAQNLQLGLQYLREAADQANDMAQANLGMRYYYGVGVAQDYAEALKWAQNATQKHNPTAEYLMGTLYRFGHGVEQNLQTALTWLRKAAAQGQADAQNAIGYMYYHGEGVEQSYTQALEWATLAAQQDHALAQYNLGCMYSRGIGALKDESLASYWFQKAGEQDREAAPLLDSLRKLLRKGDLNKADDLSQQLIRLKSGFQVIDSQQAAAAIPDEILVVLDHWWRVLAGQSLTERAWVSLSGGFTCFKGFFSLTTFLEARLKAVLNG